VPKPERNPDAGKKKDKSVKTTTVHHAVAETSVRDKQPQKEKGKKKERGDAATSSNAVPTKKQGAVPAEDDGEPVPSMIDLRVGHIVDSKTGSTPAFQPYLESVRSHEASRCGQSVCRGESLFFCIQFLT
jgi:hypothetical protein